jgi:hypothetical protein
MTISELKSELSTLSGKLSKRKLEALYAYARLLETQKDFWLTISQEEKSGIEQGENDFRNGEYTSLNETIAGYKAKFRRKRKK